MNALPRFTAVVHVASDAQAIEQTGLALSNGAGGVFLINHEASCWALVTTYRRVRERFPAAWIGVNFLDLDADEAVRVLPSGADALWMDNMNGFDANVLPKRTWRLFGGAAFKYQKHTQQCDREAVDVAIRLSLPDVITTSGLGTGEAATLGKVQLMRGAVGADRLLALASGVTPANVASYAPLVNCFLVATGISQSFYEFDPAKVRELAGRLESKEPNAKLTTA